MKIDSLIQQLERMKKMHVRDVSFVWDDGANNDTGCWPIVVSDRSGNPSGKAEIVLGCWGVNMKAIHGQEPHRL
jgi:hypothetical protein